MALMGPRSGSILCILQHPPHHMRVGKVCRHGPTVPATAEDVVPALALLAWNGMHRWGETGMAWHVYVQRASTMYLSTNLSLFLPSSCFRAAYEFHGRQLVDSTQRNAMCNPQEEARFDLHRSGAARLPWPAPWITDHNCRSLHPPSDKLAIRPNTQRCGLVGLHFGAWRHGWFALVALCVDQGSYRLASAPMGMLISQPRWWWA